MVIGSNRNSARLSHKPTRLIALRRLDAISGLFFYSWVPDIRSQTSINMAEAAPEVLTPPAENGSVTGTKPMPPHPDSFDFPKNLPTPPFIDVDGVPNFRDMGGYLISSSYLSVGSVSNTKPMTIRKGFLYRCAHPTLITEAGIKTLTHDLGVKDIYDLRSAPEIKRLAGSLAKASTNGNAGLETVQDPKTANQIPGITRHFVPVYEEEDYSPVALARKLEWYTAGPSSGPNNQHPEFSEGFVRAYRDISIHAAQSSSSNPAAYREIFQHILTKPHDPLVFHCTAGKDRTGVLAAMIYRLCGVDDDTIVWEYALTEPGLGSWRDIFIERISRTGLGNAGSPDAASNEPTILTRAEAARIVGSRAGNMRAYLRIVLDGEFGGVEQYLKEKCGFTEAEVEQIRKNLVAPVNTAEDVVKVVGIEGWTPEGGVQDGIDK